MQRFAALRSGGFLAQKFNRRTALEPTTKLSNEAQHPPLRKTAVTSWRSVVRVVKVKYDEGFDVIVRFVFGLYVSVMRWRF